MSVDDTAEPSMSGWARWNPLSALARSWGHFVRRSPATRLRTAAIVVAVVVGLVAYVAIAPSSTSVSAQAATGGLSTGGASSTRAVPVDQASTSSRGVVGNSINVVFPVVSLTSLAGKEGFAQDVEYGEQQKAIRLFVKHINDHGGINGRTINPIIQTYDPASSSEMRALCKTWTEGSPAAFAVLDGLGTWQDSNQLCITQEGHTPFIGQWSTVTDWTNLGSPYLWWTGPDQAAVLAAVVSWGKSAKLLGGARKVGVIVGNRASDQLAFQDYLLPDLRKIGVTPVVESIDANPNDTATTGAEAPVIVQQLRADGVNSIIPLIPFNVFYPLLQAETSQQYFPRLLLSDYESSIQAALGLIPIPYAKALNGQEGVTTMTLGGIDDNRPQSQGGYDPGVRACYKVWHAAYPQVPPGNSTPYIEEQGPIAGWCQVINLFATAARAAGRNLNRRTFVTAMSKINNYPGTYSPVLSYGPNKHYGPTEYQVVRLHVNQPPSSQCKMPKNHVPQGTCWVQVRSWQPLPTLSP
ncbi:MAG: ABC transporter substrate-binding protein [Acidimicrobiales bacterium]